MGFSYIFSEPSKTVQTMLQMPRPIQWYKDIGSSPLSKRPIGLKVFSKYLKKNWDFC